MHSRFIVFEGPDGSGTTRQTEFLAKKLQEEGYSVLLTAEPTDGPIGRNIRSILHGKVLPPADAVQLLFCADRAEHVTDVILPALEKGTIVVCDRYTLSTVLYGQALGLDPAWLTEINKHFPSPDLTVITLPAFELCFERVSNRKKQDLFEKRDFMEKVYDSYAAVSDPETVFVDTSKTKQENADFVWQTVRDRLLSPLSRENISNVG